MKLACHPIGLVHSPFKEKFGIPRQPGLVPQAIGMVELYPPYNRPEAVAGLDGYSHIWIQFIFHKALHRQWQPTVRPPRLGGNRRVGVFASRSPFRPNPIGLSVVRLESLDCTRGGVVMTVSGIDLLDGTPVLDIKPYLGYVDAVPDAVSGFAPAPPDRVLRVRFARLAESQLMERDDPARLRLLIESLLASDPRPAYIKGDRQQRVYGIRLYDFDLRWRVRDDEAEVLELNQLPG